MKLESAPERQFNGKPDTERSRSVLIIRCLHPSTPLRIQLIGLFVVGSIFKAQNFAFCILHFELIKLWDTTIS